MPEVNYLNFDVVIQKSGEGYRAQVQSPAGEATSHFTNPFSQIEVEHFMLSAAPGRRSVRRIDAPEVAAAKRFGERLYNSVFTGDVSAVLRSSLDEAWNRNAKLRLRLRLTDVPELADIPWEYLYNPSLNRFFALDDDTAIVRYLDVPERVRPVTVTLPLRVLVMISAPNDYDPLDVQQEWENLNEALADLKRNGIVQLDLIEDATLSALRKQLQKEQYHIFHFIGHGGFDRQTEEGVLVFRDEAGRGRFVSGQQLGWLLHNHHTLSLAILNACEGARADRADAFAGTGQSLVQQGIPAVIAMQFEITDDAAKTFAYGFYSSLALGQPVEAALTETRLTLFSEDHGLEWGTPVLYMRSVDGRVFNVQQEDASRKQARISELYHAATVAMSAEDWHAARTNWQAILAIDPGHVHATAGLEHIGKQQELARLYAEGRAHLEAGRWHEALASLSRAQAIDANYRDVSALAGDVRQRIQATQGHTQPPHAVQVAPNTPVHGMPVVDTRGAAPYSGPPQTVQQAGAQGVPTPQYPNPANQWGHTGPIAQGHVPQIQGAGGGGGGGGGRGVYEGPAPAPVPVPVPRRKMAWVVPVLMLVLLAVFGVAAFAIISAQQASERAAQATATAEVQAANSKATGTAVTRRRTATARANATGTAEAIANADATSTAYAVILEESAQSTATAQAYATQTATGVDTAARSVTIEKVYLTHNIYNSDDVKGMEIHIEFMANNLKDVPLPVNAYFSWPDGRKIISLDGTYQAPDTQVAVRKDAQPGYDAAKYDDFVIFMPYEELEMDFTAGTFDIQLHVVIYDDNEVELARSDYIPFSYTSPGPGN
ncbi:MAG: CHAT domain-containing protein [Chloroflexota bacterium]|nr:CHAT domain-containing protein [Chloroflexota bacterium]MDQ5864480.1 CHAT domain-containing protein [Chloroflexota bacterium]